MKGRVYGLCERIPCINSRAVICSLTVQYNIIHIYEYKRYEYGYTDCGQFRHEGKTKNEKRQYTDRDRNGTENGTEDGQTDGRQADREALSIICIITME